MTDEALDAAAGYVGRGWAVTSIPAGKKGPQLRGWPDLNLRLVDLAQHFGHGENVGVILGARSGELVDIDLDCTEALALADLYLPVTGAEFGRPAKPRSHRLYIAPGARFRAFTDPVSGETLVELRCDGPDGGAHQTLMPPSVADGERREWCGETIAPRGVDAERLGAAVAWLAIGCLVMRYVSEHAARRPAPDLPAMLWEFDRNLGRPAYRWLGWPDPDAPQLEPRPRRQLSRAEIDLAELVAAIPNDGGWEDWNRLGMAIWCACAGSDQGGIIFDDWSAKSPKYNPYTTAARWQHYRRSPPSRLSAGTLVYLARQNGWSPPTRAGGAR
jgi:hypothetical protein